jgi:hypothetical protein
MSSAATSGQGDASGEGAAAGGVEVASLRHGVEAPVCGDDPGEFGQGHDIGPGGRYWRSRAEMWRGWFRELVEALRPLVPAPEFPEGARVDAHIEALAIAAGLTALAEGCRNLSQELCDVRAEAEQARRTSQFHKDGLLAANAECDALKGALHDEIAANLAFRDKGRALPDEDMPTFCNRLLMERALLGGENERLRREIDDSLTKMRDRLARKAMPHFFGMSDAAGRARLAYQEADAMLAARCLNESRARLRAACEASGPLLGSGGAGQ